MSAQDEIELKGNFHIALYSLLHAGAQLQIIKAHESPGGWEQALSKIGIDEVHAQFLLNLAAEYARLNNGGMSHWQIMEKFLKDGALDKAAAFAFHTGDNQ